MSWLRHVEPLWQDLRHGARMFARRTGIVGAAFLPARRAAPVNPTEALRCE